MPELRKDPVVGRWVIISTERSLRPTSFSQEAPPKVTSFCPFCPGHEEQTPPEVVALEAVNDPGLAGVAAMARKPSYGLP